MEQQISGNVSRCKNLSDRLSGILVGWNTALLSLFLLVILASILLSFLGKKVMLGDVLFYIEVFVLGLIAILIGYKLGKKAYKLLSGLRQIYSYTILTLLLVLTVVMFPGSFQFVGR